MAFFQRRRQRDQGRLVRLPIDGLIEVEDDTPTDTFVILSVPTAKLRGMDVAVGPCVPIPGRKHALRSVHSQQGPERIDQMLALFTLLGGNEDELPEAMQLIEERGPGRLYRCSDRFVQLMADQSRHELRLIDQDKADGDKDLTRFMAELGRLDTAWMATGGWHKRMVSTRNRLSGRISYVRWAQEKGQPVFCWYGPPVPEYVVVHGQGRYQGSTP